MFNTAKNYVARLHSDESGPNTVEWILLIIIALVILIAVYFFADFALSKFNEHNEELQKQGKFLQ